MSIWCVFDEYLILSIAAGVGAAVRLCAESRVELEPIFLPSGSSESLKHSERRRREFIRDMMDFEAFFTMDLQIFIRDYARCRIFFSGEVHRSFIHSNPKMLYCGFFLSLEKFIAQSYGFLRIPFF